MLYKIGMSGNDRPLEVKVSCYAGYRGEQEPRSFLLSGRRINIDRILDRWLGPDHRYFKVRGEEGGTYILRRDEAEDRWELTMFQA